AVSRNGCIGGAAEERRDSVGQREETPRPRDALQLVLPAVVERETAADDEIDNRPRHPHLVRLRASLDSLREVDADASDVVSSTLDLAGVESDADGETSMCQRVA